MLTKRRFSQQSREMRLQEVKGIIHVSATQEELDVHHRAFRARPGIPIAVTVFEAEDASEGPEYSVDSSEPLATGQTSDDLKTDPGRLMRALRTKPGIERQLLWFVRTHPMGTPGEAVAVLFGEVPAGFGARGRYAPLYNSLYSRLRTLRVRAGHPATLRGHRPPVRSGHQLGSESPALRDSRSRETVPHVSNDELRRVMIRLIDRGGPVTVRELAGELGGGAKADDVLYRRRVSASFSNLRTQYKRRNGGAWRKLERGKGSRESSWEYRRVE